MAAAILLALIGIMGVAWYALWVPGKNHTGPLPVLTTVETELAERLERHVRAIASVPHNISHFAALQAAAAYIERTLGEYGYVVGSQEFVVDGQRVRNIDAVIEPKHTDGQNVAALVIGAHYDSYADAPGANDNGSGVAATLELARLLKTHRPATTRIRLVLFVNEEPPYFKTENMGSWRYAKAMAERGERVRGMISLETMGAFSSEPGSQRYPWPYNLIFDDRANFIAFVGLPGGRSFLHDVVRAFRSKTQFPSVAGMGLDSIPGIGWSDHWSFYKFGFPAIMITDTAPFRYAHYHERSDTPDKVGFTELARVTMGIARAVQTLAK
jgi:hypothetical protein